MVHRSLFALVVLLGLSAWIQAGPYNRGPTPPQAYALQGRWFAQGNPALPCYIEVTPGSRRLLFTNESGQQANGHILWYGNRIVASSRGNLQGQVNGNVIQWANGAYWTR